MQISERLSSFLQQTFVHVWRFRTIIISCSERNFDWLIRQMSINKKKGALDAG